MTVGERIKNRRIELGLTQEDLAMLMGYKGKSSVCAAEACGDNVTTTKVRKFAAALGVSDKYLMGWEDEEDDITRQDVSSFDPEVIEQAMFLYELYRKAPPKIQAAVETLLTPTKSDS